MTTPAHPHRARPAQGLPSHGWLMGRLALYLDRPAATIDPFVPLDAYGMDSVAALSLCGDLEEEFGLDADPTLLWDHPTAHGLLGHLESVLAPAAAEYR